VLAWTALATAVAAVPFAPPDPPMQADWSLRAEGAAGADVWTGGGGSSAQASASAWSRRTLGSNQFFGGYAGQLQLVREVGAWDGHALDLGMERSAGVWKPGWSAHLRGGALGIPAWGGVFAGPSTALQLGDGWIATQVGGGWRGDASASGASVGALLAGGFTTASSLRLRSVAEVRRYLSPDLPGFLAQIDASAALPLRSTTLLAAAGLAWTGAGDARVAGLPEPGSVLASGRLGFEMPLRGPWAATVELSAERGSRTIDYLRVRGFAGVQMRLGPVAPLGPAIRREGDVTFRIAAPEAAAVAIAGAFTGWDPVPLVTDGSGTWWVTLRLSPGEYEYNYVVDGRATVPPEATIVRPDGFGGSNGVILVTPASPGR
jgi:hypothetical protein